MKEKESGKWKQINVEMEMREEEVGKLKQINVERESEGRG